MKKVAQRELFKNTFTILSEGVMIPTKEQAPDGWAFMKKRPALGQMC